MTDSNATANDSFVVEIPRLRPNGRGDFREKDAAIYLGKSTRWLRERRKRDELPNYHRIGGCIWYPREDLDHYLDLCLHETTR